MYKIYKLGINDFDVYKQYRNYLTNFIRLSKENYYIQKFADFHLSTRRIWDTISELTNSNKTRTSPTNFVNFNSHIKNTRHEISETFNEYFRNIAPKLADKLPHNSFLCGNYPQSMVIPPMTTYERIKVINALKKQERTHWWNTSPHHITK